ncbi:MAG: carbohydrate kinase, partial [Armatimonadetes bacterium]|nr:carbohydrate kinase [Armatimonadota bacterium]
MTSPPFTTIGEILVDFTPLLEGGQTVGFRMHPGGSPFNVAVGLARLGARVEFAAKVSTDFFGRFLLAHLEREGIGRRLLSRSDAPTTLAFVALEGGEPAFSFYQDGTADTLLRPEDLSADIAACQVLHFGSISLLRDPTASTVAGLVERLRGDPLL